ncbi:MAG: response regulator, partial [Anaerolineae bacterium]
MTERTILYIEDNPENRLLVKRTLEASGYSVKEAIDGPSGLKAATESHPDVILLDISLPAMDGYDLARRFSEYPHLEDVPVLAVTANVMKGDKERALGAGCHGYIPKPINIDKLPIEIEQALERFGRKHGGVETTESQIASDELADTQPTTQADPGDGVSLEVDLSHLFDSEPGDGASILSDREETRFASAEAFADSLVAGRFADDSLAAGAAHERDAEPRDEREGYDIPTETLRRAGLLFADRARSNGGGEDAASVRRDGDKGGVDWDGDQQVGADGDGGGDGQAGELDGVDAPEEGGSPGPQAEALAQEEDDFDEGPLDDQGAGEKIAGGHVASDDESPSWREAVVPGGPSDQVPAHREPGDDADEPEVDGKRVVSASGQQTERRSRISSEDEELLREVFGTAGRDASDKPRNVGCDDHHVPSDAALEGGDVDRTSERLLKHDGETVERDEEMESARPEGVAEGPNNGGKAVVGGVGSRVDKPVADGAQRATVAEERAGREADSSDLGDGMPQEVLSTLREAVGDEPEDEEGVEAAPGAEHVADEDRAHSSREPLGEPGEESAGLERETVGRDSKVADSSPARGVVAAEPAGEENVVGALPSDSELRLPAGKEADVIEVMTSLADELGAEAVVLMRGPHVLTSVGQIGDGAMKQLADIMAEGFRASDRVASLLGCSQGCLEHIVDI